MGMHEFNQARWLTGGDLVGVTAVASAVVTDPVAAGDPDAAQAIARATIVRRRAGLRFPRGLGLRPIRTRALGDIHGGIGLANQGLGVGSISGKDCKPGAESDLDGVGTDHDRLFQAFGYSCGDPVAFGLASTWKQDRELVATKAGDRVALPCDCGEPPGHLAEYLVTCKVAKGVVYVLEPVDIEHKKHKLLVATTGSAQRVLKALSEEGSVGQVGQRVVHRQVLQLPLCIIVGLFGELLLGDVPDEKTHDPFTRTYDRCDPALKPPRTCWDLEAVFEDLGAPSFEGASDGSDDAPADFVPDRFANGSAEQLAWGAIKRASFVVQTAR